jgi:DNA-binding NarL/FixJ family response regulator
MFKLLLVDDDVHIRDAVRDRLSECAGWKICGECENGAEAVQFVESLQPHLILLDIQMPVMNGFEAARQILCSFPDMLILIVSFHQEQCFAEEAKRCGARGFLSKSELGNHLIPAISALLRGDLHFPTLTTT